MYDAARKLEKQGRSVIHLEIGRPDFDTPSHIVAAAVDALQAGKHHYSPNAGIPELCQAIAKKYASEYSLEYNPANEIVVTNGVAEGLYLAVHALLNPGDQILIPDPRWINYDIDALTHFVEPISYSLDEDNGFQPEPEEIEQKITSRTKMLLLASPSNPTGGVIRKDCLIRLSELAAEYDLIVLSDEIYEKIIYPPAEHVSIATLDGMKSRTVLLNGFSKTYSMTGWSLLSVPLDRCHRYGRTPDGQNASREGRSRNRPRRVFRKKGSRTHPFFLCQLDGEFEDGCREYQRN